MSVVYVLAVPESDRHAMLASSMIDFHCMRAITVCVFDQLLQLGGPGFCIVGICQVLKYSNRLYT